VGKVGGEWRMKKVFVLEANTSNGLAFEINQVLQNELVEITDIRYQATWNKGDNEMSYSALMFVNEYTNSYDDDEIL
jgi:hypothetical protein